MSSQDLLGGWSETLRTDIQVIANKVKSELEKGTGKKYPVFDVIVYRYQIVAGTNYLIKVSVSISKDECVHLKVFQSLPCDEKDPSLSGYQMGKTRPDPLVHFD